VSGGLRRSPPKRRYDLIGDAIEQAITGQGGGRGPVRKRGVEADPPPGGRSTEESR
jgi:hypothetical protein